ncbi:MAG TPA: HRDC domain-containing protein, partial [Acidimicrobiales bacterium]
WTVAQIRGIADQVPEKDGVKVHRLADDLDVVVAAGRGGTARTVLEAVRDDVGLGSAMSLLDRTGGGQGSSHLDDLEGLLGVADLHPDVAGFEPWLRTAFQKEADATGVTLSTVHRVKGREWDRVAVFGVADGVMPHRLADDLEEERRVLHVAITRGRHRVVVLADRTRPSLFIAELDGSAPKRAPSASKARQAEVAPQFKKPAKAAAAAVPVDGIEATRGLVVKVLGGYEGTIEEVDGRTAQLRLATGGTLSVRFGERVEHDGRKAPLVAPSELWGPAADAEAALRAWRTTRSKADAVPAYVVVNDRYLRGIALARPSTTAELANCDGIGPAKLEKYGDEILEVLEAVAVPAAPAAG